MRSHILKSRAGTLFKADARVMLWDISNRGYERSEMQDSGDPLPQELDGMQWMLGRTADMVALMVLEQRTAGQEDVNAVRCHECPDSIEGIPSGQTPSLSYCPTGKSQIVDNSSLDRYPLVSKSKCSRIVGIDVHIQHGILWPNQAVLSVEACRGDLRLVTERSPRVVLIQLS